MSVETINIKTLVENSPLTKFKDQDYNSKLIEKLRNNFTEYEEQLFLTSFYMYLNHDPNDFVINLRNTWEWLGFSRLDKSIRLLTNEFTENIDYKVFPRSGENPKGGRPVEDTFLTIKCFKKFCLKARTTKADKIHDYYLKLEESVQELLFEESKELRTQLALKNYEIELKEQELKIKEQELKIKELEEKLWKKEKKELKENNKTLENNNQVLEDTKKTLENEVNTVITEREQGIINGYRKKRVFYIGKTEENVIKFGFSDQIESRIYKHKNEIGTNFTFNYVYETTLNRELEREIKKKFKKNRITREYNGKSQTELIQLDSSLTIEKLNKDIIELKKKLEEEDNIKKDEKIQELTNKLDTINKKRSFIARHINTGEERILTSYSEARLISNIGSHSLRDNYLDKPCHSRGWTYRTKGNPYWQPPKNFKTNLATKPSSHMKMCRSKDKETKEKAIYNSVVEAAHFIGLKSDTDRRNLNRVINGGVTNNPKIKKYDWKYIDVCGHWVYEDGTREKVKVK